MTIDFDNNYVNPSDLEIVSLQTKEIGKYFQYLNFFLEMYYRQIMLLNICYQ